MTTEPSVGQGSSREEFSIRDVIARQVGDDTADSIMKELQSLAESRISGVVLDAALRERLKASLNAEQAVAVAVLTGPAINTGTTAVGVGIGSAVGKGIGSIFLQPPTSEPRQ